MHIIQQRPTITAPCCANYFFLMFPKSSYKKIFIGSELGEALQRMSSTKLIPKGLKLEECKHDMGGKNSPICYIPKKDPIQDAPEKSKKTTYFKLTLSNTRDKLMVAIWTTGTPKQFLLHLCSALHMCKQMGLDMDYADDLMVLEAAYCQLDAAKTEYAQLVKATKKRVKDQKEKGANLDPDVRPQHLP